jgi:hypothetical protein
VVARTNILRALVLVIVGGCGGSEDQPDAGLLKPCKEMGGSACFQLPTAPVSTREGAPSALGCGFVPRPAPSAVTFSGTVRQFGSSTKLIPNASIKLYGSADYGTPLATTTSDATDATYSITVPAGTDRLYGEFSGAGYLTIYPEDVRVDLTMGDLTMFNLQLVTPDIIEGAAIPVKEIWDPESAVFAGTAYDCDRLIIMHAAIVVSTVQGQRAFAPGVSVYYGAAGAAPIAISPDDRADTNDNGAFALFHLKPGTQLYAQSWGFVDAAAQAKGEAGLTLIAEHPLKVVPNTTGNVSLWAR